MPQTQSTDDQHTAGGPAVSPFGEAPQPLPTAPTNGVPDSGTQAALAEYRVDAANIDSDKHLRITFDQPTAVSRVRVAGPLDPALKMESGLLQFDDGSRLLLTADEDGDVDVVFPERTVTQVTLDVLASEAAHPAEAIDSWTVEPAAALTPLWTDSETPTAWASSNAGLEGALAFLDGDPATGDPGNEWIANPHDRHAAVGLSWKQPREIASVQVLGPSWTAFDPAYAAAAPLHGVLTFDDGSTVKIAGIAGGSSQPTTVAFVPRMTTNVLLTVFPTIEAAHPGLREFRAYETGTTPPRWPMPASRYALDAPDAACEGGSAPSGSGSGSGALTLLCPAPGAGVSGETPILVAAPPGVSVEASAWSPQADGSGAIVRVDTAVADSHGIARLTADMSVLTHGPTAVRLTAGGDDADELYVQLVNHDGVSATPSGHAPTGMTLQWAEEFTAPLQVSHWGDGAVYAATKPAYWGSSTFGSAILVDPEERPDTLAVVGGDYLRIRAQPAGEVTDPNGWGRAHTSGLLSSLRVGADGFSAQYGYFEARMLAPAGTGSWPAFWMLDAESATKRGAGSSSEVDAVELYGHDTTASCHALHHWISGADSGQVSCLWPNGLPDWALTWHTYGAQITPNETIYTIDGVEVATLPAPAHAEDPFYFLLNLSLGGGYDIELDGTRGVIDLYVDWVRVYT